MNRATGGSSKLLTRKWQGQDLQKHIRKLTSIKSASSFITADTQPVPPTIKYTVKNKKKIQLQDDRYSEIERENRILLEKMANIMVKKRPKSQFTENLHQEQIRNKKSLNSQRRKNNLVKITQENQHILKRLQDQSSRFSTAKWSQENKVRKKYLKNISQCSNKLLEKQRLLHNRTLSRSTYSYISSQSDPKENYQGYNEQSIIKARQIESRLRHKLAQPSTADNESDESGVRHRQLSPLRISNQPISGQILFKQPKKINNNYYLVEISKHKSLDNEERMVIRAFDIEKPETLIIEIPPEKSVVLNEIFHYKYNELADQLRIIGNKLVILAPTRSTITTQPETISSSISQSRIRTGEHSYRENPQYRRNKSMHKLPVNALYNNSYEQHMHSQNRETNENLDEKGSRTKRNNDIEEGNIEETAARRSILPQIENGGQYEEKTYERGFTKTNSPLPDNTDQDLPRLPKS